MIGAGDGALWVLAGVACGITAAAPLAAALIMQRKRAGNVSIVHGAVGVMVSFALLIVSVVIMRLAPQGAIVPIAVGEVASFLACIIVLTVGIMVRDGR